MGFWLTSLSGFASLLLIGLAVLIPYVTRWFNRRRSTKINFSSAMGLHQTAAYVVLAITVVHMYAAMGAGIATRVNGAGLTIATIALLLLLTQLIVGTTLRHAEPIGLLLWKRIHWSIMLGIVTLAIAHVWLNGMLTYAIL